MTSLEIMNLALARLGAVQATSLSDTNKNPRLAIQAYPFARDEVLRYHPWPCITSNAILLDDTDLTWITATEYTVGDLVIYSSRLYECITAGTSAFAPSTTASDITYGTVHWKYICAADNLVWKASTTYTAGDRVVNASRLYKCITTGQSAGSGGPTTTASDITDNAAHWKFLSEYANITDYAYQYVIPKDTLAILQVGDKTQYKREGFFIYSDELNPSIKYIRASTEPDEWDNFIQEAIALRLAMMICEAVTGSATKEQQLQQEYLQILTSGMSIASGEASEEPAHETRWEEA